METKVFICPSKITTVLIKDSHVDEGVLNVKNLFSDGHIMRVSAQLDASVTLLLWSHKHNAAAATWAAEYVGVDASLIKLNAENLVWGCGVEGSL